MIPVQIIQANYYYSYEGEEKKTLPYCCRLNSSRGHFESNRLQKKLVVLQKPGEGPKGKGVASDSEPGEGPKGKSNRLF